MAKFHDGSKEQNGWTTAAEAEDTNVNLNIYSIIFKWDWKMLDCISLLSCHFFMMAAAKLIERAKKMVAAVS